MCVTPIGNISVGHVFTLCVDTVIGQLHVMETNCLSQKYSYTLPTLSALIIKISWHFFTHTLWKPNKTKPLKKTLEQAKINPMWFLLSCNILFLTITKNGATGMVLETRKCQHTWAFWVWPQALVWPCPLGSSTIPFHCSHFYHRPCPSPHNLQNVPYMST